MPVVKCGNVFCIYNDEFGAGVCQYEGIIYSINNTKNSIYCT